MRKPRAMILVLGLLALSIVADAEEVRHLLYVAVPGIRDEPQHGGNGILIYDIDHGHQFVRRINVPALGDAKHSKAAKGICASSVTGRLYVSTPQNLTCVDLVTEKVIWEKTYDSGCDRMSISPDGKIIYEPTIEKEYWHVLDAESGEEIAKVNPSSGAHNTIYGLDGKHCFLAGLKSPLLTVTETVHHTSEKTIGPFGDVIRPFTVNGSSTRCYVCVNGLLGFEIGDLIGGKKLARVEVSGFELGPTKRHGCPSHGIGLTPDEKEIWLCDSHNSRVHIFDNTVMPPKQVASVVTRDQPGWITFSIEGRYAYPSTGEVIDVKTRTIVLGLKDENRQDVHSEKLMEIDFAGNKPTAAGNQFGIGRVTSVSAD